MALTVHTHPEERVVIEDVELSAPNENQVRIKTAYSYISAGTELTGLQMGSNVNRKGKRGHRPLGYSLAGTVLEVGTNVAHVAPGDKVSCIGAGAAHAAEVVMAKNLVVPVPEGVSLREAAPAAMMCFALGGVRKARLEFGENVLVLGGGAMGQIASQLALASGANVYLMDTNEKRLCRAIDGVKQVLGDNAGWDRIKAETAPVGIEAALICFGGDATAAFDKIKTVMCKAPDNVAQGRVVSSGGCTITVSLASASGNIAILSSAKAGPGYRDDDYEAGADYPIGYVKWTVTRNVKVLLDAVAAGHLQIAPLITHEYPFMDALAAYEHLATPGTDALMVLLKYD